MVDNTTPVKTPINGEAKRKRGRPRGTISKYTRRAQSYIAKKSDAVNILIKGAKGDFFPVGGINPETGEDETIWMRPSVSEQIKSASLLLNKFVPDVKSVDITTSSDESASFPTREKLLDMFRELAVDTDYSVESIDKETPDNPIEQAGSTPGSTESTGIDDK